MTPEQVRWQRIKAHEKDTRALIARKFTSSRMCTTKWRHVAKSLADLQLNWQIKFIDVENSLDNGNLYFVIGDWFDSL